MLVDDDISTNDDLPAAGIPAPVGFAIVVISQQHSFHRSGRELRAQGNRDVDVGLGPQYAKMLEVGLVTSGLLEWCCPR